MRLITEAALDYVTHRMQDWYAGRPELWDIDFNNIEREAILIYHATDNESPEYQERGRASPSFADPLGNYSPILDAIDQLKVARPDLPATFWVELLIAILRHNSSSMLRNLILSWMPGRGDSARLFEEGWELGYGPHTLLLQECERRNIRIGSGKFPRCQWSMSRRQNWPDERNRPDVTEQVHKDICTMTNILEDAENPQFLHGVICERVQQLKHIGPVKALGFYTIAVHAGILRSEHAIRESYEAVLHEGNPGAQWLRREGLRDLDKTLHQLAWRMNRTKSVVEHSLCKMYRHPAFCWDFIASDQKLYCSRREVDGRNQEFTRFYKRTLNGPWQAYTPHLPGF